MAKKNTFPINRKLKRFGNPAKTSATAKLVKAERWKL